MANKALVLAACFAALGLAAAIYAIQTDSGKKRQGMAASSESGAQCSASDSLARELDSLSRGDMAAFRIARQPEWLGDLSFNDSEGERISLSSLRGNVVLLNLWATWCVPCREEMPELNELQARMESEAFETLPVSMDFGPIDKPRRFYEEENLDRLPLLHDPQMSVFNRLKGMGLAFGLPATLLLDSEGCLLGSLNGPAAWGGEDAARLASAALASR